MHLAEEEDVKRSTLLFWGTADDVATGVFGDLCVQRVQAYFWCMGMILDLFNILMRVYCFDGYAMTCSL